MSPWVSLPSSAELRRAAARAELDGALEAVRCALRLLRRGSLGPRERRLLAAIGWAADRARRAAARLDR